MSASASGAAEYRLGSSLLCACVRACVCVRECVRASCVRACVRECVRVHVMMQQCCATLARGTAVVQFMIYSRPAVSASGRKETV
jgi:hypothetical protein